jgi:hypothetical protein
MVTNRKRSSSEETTYRIPDIVLRIISETLAEIFLLVYLRLISPTNALTRLSSLFFTRRDPYVFDHKCKFWVYSIVHLDFGSKK